MVRALDLLMDLRATLDEIERPWAAFIGLVTLHPSPYVSGDAVYALNPQQAGFAELSPSVVLHPDTIPAARSAASDVTGRSLSDDELAAMLYWHAHKHRQA